MTGSIPDAGNALIYFTGELDASSARRIAGRIAAARATCPASITADVSKATFIGPAAVGAFIRARSECADTGTQLRIRGPQPAALRAPVTGPGAR